MPTQFILQFSYVPSILFFFNDPATTELYTLSPHDALPISIVTGLAANTRGRSKNFRRCWHFLSPTERSEEHTSELQSRLHLVCRLLLEKKKQQYHRLPERREHRE